MDKIIKSSLDLRWDPYIYFKNKDCGIFFSNHLGEKDKPKSILFVLGLGFDPRMNFGIKELVKSKENQKINVLLFSFKQDRDDNARKYESLVNENLRELRSLPNLTIEYINLKDLGKKREIEAVKHITKASLSIYTDIFLDISSLPRSIYFSLSGKTLSIIDSIETKIKKNFFILTTENAEIDSLIQEYANNDLEYQYGFGGQIETVSKSIPKIWFPIVGENKTNQFRIANQFIEPEEICPVLPFPSKNLRRSDDIYVENHDLFFDELKIETQNIMYVPEQNAFETYKKIIKASENYNKTLKELGGCKTVISTFSSKLLSIGALLAAYECKSKDKDLNIGILNVNSLDYKIKSLKKMHKLGTNNELFVNWLTGTPYQ